MLIVDDALLLRVLALTAPKEFLDEARNGQVFTTGSWYYRLAKAVAQPKVAGALSTAMAALPPVGQERARAGLHSLPPIIGMVNLRTLVPTMAALHLDRPLNILAAEASWRQRRPPLRFCSMPAWSSPRTPRSSSMLPSNSD